MSNPYVLTYNGTTFPISHIDEFVQETIMSDDGVDVLYNHVKFTIRALINKCINDTTMETKNGTLLQLWQKNLLEPRKALKFTIDGVDVINIPDGGDFKNGPTPIFIRFNQINGSTIFADFSIEAWLDPCTVGTSPPDVMLSNRWTQQQDIDENGYTTITTTGSLIIAGLMTAGGGATVGGDVDAYRGAIFPIGKIPAGFQRAPQTYLQSSDGTRLDYTIVDSEKYIPATTPVATWTGTWTESGKTGPVIHGTLNLTATAKKDITKDALLQWIFKVAQSRIRFPGDVPLSFSITEHLSENRVDFSMQVLCQSNKAITNFNGRALGRLAPNANDAANQLTRIGSALVNLTDGTAVNQIGNRGNYLTELFINKINSNCADKNSTVTLLDGTSGLPTVYTTSSYANAQSTIATPTQIKDSSIGNAYLKNQVEIEYEEGNETSLMPLSFAGSDPKSATSNLINLGSFNTYRTVKFYMERLNAFPEIPVNAFPSAGDGSYLVKESKVVCQNPQLLPSGVDRIWTMYGKYVFIMQNSALINQNGTTLGLGPGNIIFPASPEDTINSSDGSHLVNTTTGSGPFTQNLAPPS